MATVFSGDTGKGTDLPSGDTTAIQLDDGNLVVLAFKDPQLVAAPYGGGDLLGKGLIRFLNPNTGATTKPDIILGTGKTIVHGIEKTPDNGFIVYGQAKESLYGKQFGGATDAFIIKYKSDGAFQWIQSFNTSLHESIASASIDPSGRILVSGRTSYDLSEPRVFGSQSWYGQALGGRYYAAFTSSISAQGSVDWVNVYGGLSGGIGIAADKNGYVSSIYTGVNSTPTNYSYFDYSNNLKWSKDVNVNDYAAAMDVFYGQGIISIVSGSNQVSLVNESGALLKTISAPNGGTVHDIEVRGDKLFLLSRSGASSNLEVSVYDKSGLQQGVSISIPGSAEFVDKYYFEYDLEILADGKYLISGNTGDAGFAGAVVGDYREYILFDPNPKPVIRGNSLYTIVDGPSWTQAEANSVKLGGHLVTINDAGENQFVWSLIKSGSDLTTWMGGTDKDQEGRWKWSSGQTWDYTNWIPDSEPNNNGWGAGIPENFLVISKVEGLWMDNFENNWAEYATNKGIAETPFIRRGDSAYVIVQGPTWEEAEANAVKLGGHLVTINDAEENAFIYNTFKDEVLKGYWEALTGLYKDADGTWKWVDGDSSQYRNWHPGEPNNFGTGEFLGAIGFHNGGLWNDGNNTVPTIRGIAEIKLAPNNTPIGTPTLSGTFKAGQVITIDRTPLQDADNFTGYTPDFTYTWEVSSNGTTWTKLTTTDATDNNTTYTLTAAEVGKQVRGVVSYLDGYGTSESVASTGSSLIQAGINLEIGSTSTTSSKTTTLASTISRLTLTGTGNINGTGNALNNYLTGNAGNNILDGGSGYDILDGGKGNDTYIVDSIYDSIIENANEGTDTVRSSVDWTLGANLENLTLIGSAAISGTGNTLNNILTGNAGSNILDGGSGADTLAGGAGDDTYIVDDAGDRVTEGAAAGTDTVQSSVSYTLGLNLEHLILTGSASINGTGNTLNNSITGNAGNNILDGVTGADTMAGGAGDDTYRVDNIGDVVRENANEGIDSVQSSITYALAANIENLSLTGTAAINGTGNELNNLLTGNSAANVLSGGAGDDTYLIGAGDSVLENANEGTDTVQSSVTYTLAANVENLILAGAAAINGTGNDLANIITGNIGNNILDGGTGADTLVGGDGNDTYVVDHAGDVVTEAANAGTDTVRSAITYTLGSDLEHLTLIGSAAIDGTGNAATNTITGNSGNNVLDGGAGSDTLVGGLGDDTYVIDQTGDVIIEGVNAGTDTVQSSVTYTLAANLENLTLTGATAINGTGNTLNNVLRGNAAANILIGGVGADVLTGLGGADTFRYNALSDSRLAAFDRITDFAIGTDIFDGPTAVSAANTKELGAVATLDQAGISKVLTAAVFGANQAATFSFGLGASARTFLALNDATAGFSSASDGIIEITGYTGLLTNLEIV